MTITALGSMSVGAAVPGAASAVAAGISGINGALPDILARITALQAFAPMPVSFASQLTLANATLGSVQAAITAGIPAPDISMQIATVAAIVVDLLAQVAAVNAQLDVLVGLQSQLAVAGVGAYVFDGQLGSMGAELAAQLGTGTAHANALALVTTSAAAWAGLSAIVKVTP